MITVLGQCRASVGRGIGEKQFKCNAARYSISGFQTERTIQPCKNEQTLQSENCYSMADQLSKLSLQELVDLNAAVQHELTQRLLQLEEENKRRRSCSIRFDPCSDARFHDHSRESGCFRLERCAGKAEQEFWVDQHRKAESYCLLFSFVSPLGESIPLQKRGNKAHSFKAKYTQVPGECVWSWIETSFGMSSGATFPTLRTYSSPRPPIGQPRSGASTAMIRGRSSSSGTTRATRAPSTPQDTIPHSTSSAPRQAITLATSGSPRALRPGRRVTLH